MWSRTSAQWPPRSQHLFFVSPSEKLGIFGEGKPPGTPAAPQPAQQENVTTWKTVSQHWVTRLRQRTYVAQRRFRVTTVAVENQYLLNIMSVYLYSSLIYPACESQAPYCSHLWSVRLHYILPHNLIKCTIFGKILNIKCVFLIFCTTFVWIISRSKKNSAKYYHKFA
jgi:hypothetical protein